MSMKSSPYRHLLYRKIGSFLITDYIGEGTFGVVFKVEYLTDNPNRPSGPKSFAMKLLRGAPRSLLGGTSGGPGRFPSFRVSQVGDVEAESLFDHERAALESLRHSNIVRICGHGRYNGNYYIVLELMEGGRLDLKMEELVLAPPRYAAEVLRKLALATAYAHGFGIIHRDLKPSNILLTPEGEPKISDFGTVKFAEFADGTCTGDFRGTLAYMAPEQLLNRPQTRSDIYSLGVILYQMLTGHLPIESDGYDIAGRVLAREEIPRPRWRHPTLPRALDAICMRCLSWEPLGRYPNASLLAEELERYLSQSRASEAGSG